MEWSASAPFQPIFVHFFGVRRSGNHAVIHWLSEGLKEGGRYSILHFNSVADSWDREVRLDYIQGEIDRLRPDYVVLSYEDCPFQERLNLAHYEKFSNGKDKDREVILLRSFPNLMASQIQRRRNLEKKGELEVPIWATSLADVRDVWVEHARNILSSGPNSFSGLLYDTWVTQAAYRDEIGKGLGFTNQDAGLDYVPDYGDGSSFSGTSLQGRGNEMRTLDRWRLFVSNADDREAYMALVTPEMIELHTKLFGFDPVSLLEQGAPKLSDERSVRIRP